MAIRNNKLGGTDWIKEHPTFQDMNATMDAVIDLAAVGIAQNAYQTLQANDVFDNKDYLAADEFTDSTGTNNTVNTGSTTALFGGSFYSLMNNYNLGVAAYDSKRYDISANVTTPLSLFMKPDGTKYYVADDTGDTIYQYSMGTAGDITTSSYDSKSFSVGTQEADPHGFFIGNSGTKLYVVGEDEFVYQYTLATGWDISTASYDSKSYDFSSEGTTGRGVWLSDDGETMFICIEGGSGVYQYTLGTAWDVSTASYDSKSLSTSNEISTEQSLIVSDNGYTVLVGDETGDDIFEYELTTAYDLSTGFYTGKTFSISSQSGNPEGYSSALSGTKLYLVIGGQFIYQYSMGEDTISSPAIAVCDTGIKTLDGTEESICVYGDSTIYTDTNITVDISDGTTTLSAQSLNTVIALDGFTSGTLELTFNLNSTDSSVAPKLYGWGVYIK